MELYKRFITYYKPHKKILFNDLFFATIMSLIDIAIPLIVAFMLKEVFVSNDMNYIVVTAMKVSSGLFILYLIKMGCSFYVTYYGHKMGVRIEADMRNDLFDKLIDMPYEYYDNNNTGRMISRLIHDLSDIAELAHHGPENIFISLIKIIGAFLILSNINFILSLSLLTVLFAMIIFSKILRKKMIGVLINTRKKVAKINENLQDSLSGVRVVKSFVEESREKKKFRKGNDEFVDSKTEFYRHMSTFSSVNGVLQGFMYIIIFMLGSYLVTKGDLEGVDIVTFLLYIGLFLEPIRVLITFTELYQRGITGFKRMQEVIDMENVVKDKENPIVLEKIKGDITFNNVHFNYEDNTKILKDISISVKHGTTLALVGASGVGKSSLCALIPRFYDVTKGSVKIDGIDIRDVTKSSLRKSIGVVQQDVYIFNSTIRENISYGKTNATDEQIIEASKKANIHDYISSLEKGYDTFLGERGIKLSGGQKQRLSIARVFLKNPPILILDEATASLDNESEKFIQNSLEELSKNRTTIVIAHRLSTIKNADRIVYLTKNGVEEEGTHKELITRNGSYARLYNMQFI